MNLIQHYIKENQLHSSTLWNYSEVKFKSMSYHPFHANRSWTSVYNLTRQCYQPIKISFPIFKLQILLLCDSLIYSNSNEHLSKSTKIVMVKVFLITCLLNHLRDAIFISWDIIVPLLRISIVINIHQQWSNLWGY